MITSKPRQRSPLPDPRVPLLAAPLLLLVFLVPAVGEEMGWTGYATDPLQDRWGATTRTLDRADRPR
jgi:membrane protease YdiL (CAAX protease family)